MRVGQSVSLTPVAKALVDSRGKYKLRIHDLGSLSRFANDAGNVDFEVRASEAGYVTNSSFTRELIPAPAGGSPALQRVEADDVEPDQIAARRAAQREPATKSPELIDTELTTSRALPYNKRVAAAESGNKSAVHSATQVCGETLVRQYPNRKVAVGWTFAVASNSQAKFVYSKSSSSSLGVGLSATGTYGSYSASGRVSRSSTKTIPFGWHRGPRRYSTFFRFGKYEKWCHPIHDSSAKYVYAYVVRANKFEGGSPVNNGTTPKANHCRPMGAGTGYILDKTYAHNWSQGVSIKSKIGINLAARTGFGSKAKLNYQNKSSVTRNLCGTKDLPGGAPKRVVLRRKT